MAFIIAGAVVMWLGIIVLAVAACAASGRADRKIARARIRGDSRTGHAAAAGLEA